MSETRNYNVSALQAGSYFTDEVYLDEGFLLATPEISITKGVLNALSAWNFDTVYSAGVPRDTFQGTAREQREFTQNDAGCVTEAERFCALLKEWTGELFESASLKQQIRFSDVAEKIKDVISAINKNRRFLLQVLKNIDNVAEESYQLSHAVKCTIISLVLGQSFRLPIHRLIELGAAALVHEIGMVCIPSKVYLSDTELTSAEREMIYMHPSLGYDLLRANDFPLSVCVPAMEHHERENGSGYPSKLNGNGIGLYSKIIAVVCSYEAITTNRPHKDAEDEYHGMLRMLRNENKQYDDSVLNALVRNLSLFPIGLYVVLSNGKKAQVVDANPADPRCPIVQVFDEQTPDGRNKILTTDSKGIYITQVLDRSDMQDGAPSLR
jgi:HD-GYP domain-containing protein (c-di-GMP phosphodiesterase class II)